MTSSSAPQAAGAITAPGATDQTPRSVRRALTTLGQLPAHRRRWLAAMAWLVCGMVLFVCYLRISRTVPVNSDGAANALQAWDMLHGNVLLRGWWLSDVSFYTTELPEYALVELVRGLNSDVVHVAAALTYTLLVLLAAVLAKGRATGREAAVRMLLAAGIMLAPQLGAGASRTRRALPPASRQVIRLGHQPESRTNSRYSADLRASMNRPLPCRSRRWRFTKPASAPTTPTRPPGWTTWPSPTASLGRPAKRCPCSSER